MTENILSLVYLLIIDFNIDIENISKAAEDFFDEFFRDIEGRNVNGVAGARFFFDWGSSHWSRASKKK